MIRIAECSCGGLYKKRSDFNAHNKRMIADGFRPHRIARVRQFPKYIFQGSYEAK